MANVIERRGALRPTGTAALTAAWDRLPTLLRVRVRLILVCTLSVLGMNVWRGDILAPSHVSLAEAAGAYGLTVERKDAAALVRQRQGKNVQRIVFRAREGRDLGEIYLAEAVISREGRVSGLSEPYNLSRTSSADESAPFVLGRYALFSRRVEGKIVALEILDLGGEAPSEQGLLARVQRGITNLQQTGVWSGVGRRSYVLREQAQAARAKVQGSTFEVILDGAQRAVFDPAAETPRVGAELFEVRTHATVVPSFVAWSVDTVRGLSFVGAEPIAWLENKVFALRDSVKQAYHGVSGTDHEAEVAEELLVATQTTAQLEKVERLSVPNPDSGWPPPAVDPLTTPAVAGEGKWRAIIDDPYGRVLPSGQPVFYQTFLRPDPQRTWARVYLTVWDPRLVQLNMVAGTAEPVSATGETGTGLVPRDPATLQRLVAAFNGGFQAVHGEFGMMTDGRVYLPPKPWAATVAIFSDGRVGMGSWPGPAERGASYDEAKAVAEIPAGMIAFRQNLTSLVEDAVFNPWGRWWWGAAPNQPAEQTLTQRSALCVTREGFMIYAWGDSMLPEALGQALLSARCVRAIHLDMNASHCGMELYNVTLGGVADATVNKKRDKLHFDGSVPGLANYRIRARRAIASMGLEVPRYIQPDPRDYFYLTLKQGIESSPLPAGAPAFDTSDLPHAGWPPALARAKIDKGRLLRIDPARAVPLTGAGKESEVVLAEVRGRAAPGALDDQALYVQPGAMRATYAVGVPPPESTVVLTGRLLTEPSTANIGLGVDAEGLLVYAEIEGREPGALARTFAQLGVKNAIELTDRARLGLNFREGVLEMDGRTRLRDGETLLRFVASAAPATEVLYPDNRPMPYSRWAQLQDKRVRYFRTGDPTAKAPPGTLKQ